tara:strand:- start:314 stop:1138 length:825 start_codon:yes stop_codon:yes gene_type:complete
MNIYELINNEKNLEIATNNKNNIVDNNDTYLNSNECLISNKPLDNNYITLDCNHKFNYQELYDEFKYQKTNKNYYDTSRPLPHQIKCPYCRSFTDKVLPYFKPILSKGYCPVIINKKFDTVKLFECSYISKSSNQSCNLNCCLTEFGKLCNKHYTIMKNANDRKLLKETIKKNIINNNKKINIDENIEKDNNVTSFDHLLLEYHNDSIIYLKYKLDNNHFDRLTVPQLKLLLKINKCKVSGIKIQLIERILNKKQEYQENNIVWNNTIYKYVKE